MQFRKTRFAILSLCALTLALGSAGCGKSPKAPANHSRPVYSAIVESNPLSGDWLEVACNEGDAGPDLPPPPYMKGVIRFREHTMHWSSRIYDDKDCSALRPSPIAETVVPYVLATNFATTDGSVAIDVQVPNNVDGHPVTMYGLVKQVNGQLYVALFPTADTRPKGLDRGQAQVFSPM